ncbi:aminodeoxychorismate lyase [Alteromonas sp. D210916BOD_24]|uniref:aminodeoxychorismate lyase n=1 Tax=Alteromonas sp. D210916BOD_24 TaxID=3157618 RepID=UPI00399CA5D7
MKILTGDTPILPSDRAFNYGDGVFTTLCVNSHVPQLLKIHLSRLFHDANAIGLHVDIDAIKHAILEEVARNKRAKSAYSSASKYVLKVHISAGEAGRGYGRSATYPPLARISCHAYPTHYEALAQKGLTLMCADTRLAIQPLLAGVKHLNRLEQVLIKREIEKAEVDDAIVCDTNDKLVESSAGNLFIYTESAWYTPSLKGSGVNGVVRQCLVDSLFDENAEVHVGEYPLALLYSADAVVITNALMGVMPVSRILFPNDREREYPINADAITHLQSLLHAQYIIERDEISENR